MLSRLKDIKEEVKELRNDLLEQKEYLLELKKKDSKKYKKQYQELASVLDKIDEHAKTISVTALEIRSHLPKDDGE